MAMQAHARERGLRQRGVPALVAAILVGLASASPPSGVAAQVTNNPIVQVICEVNGGTTRTVRVTYPPGLTFYGPVIVIPPFKVVGRMCERSQPMGSPSS